MPHNYLPPVFGHIPAELRALPRWVTWKAEGALGEKPRKVPYSATLPDTRASSTDPQTWGTFAQAEAAFLDGDRAGVGFVLNGDGLVGVDIDHCADAGTGEVNPAALRLLEQLNAGYVEFSPSGQGLHAFGYGEGLKKGTKGLLDGLEVELYSTGRYLTLTGHTLKAGPLQPLQGFAALAQKLDFARVVNLATTGEAPLPASEEKHADCMRRILSGDAGLHDALRDLAASLVKKGMQPGAVVNHLRGLMDCGAAPRDDRWVARRAEIPGLVESAARKFGSPEMVEVAALLERLKAGPSGSEEEHGPGGEPTTPKRYKLRSAREVAALPPPKWVIKGVLPQAGLGCLFGAPGAGKSFLALDMGATIAEGGEWFGHRVKPAPVIYLALEGAAGFAMRCRAWAKARDRPMPSDLHIVAEAFSFARPEDCADLVAAIMAGLPPDTPPPVIIFDTLARASAGMDENSTEDMGRLVAAADAIAKAAGGFSLLVHHSGKDETRGMRGSSVLHGAMDLEIRAWRTSQEDKQTRHWRAEKVKDGPDGFEHTFALREVEVGADEDGDPLTSCAVEALEAGKEGVSHAKRPSAAQRAALDTLVTAAKESGELNNAGCFIGVNEDAWRDVFYAASTAEKQETKKKAFQRARDALREAGLVTAEGTLYTLTDPALCDLIAQALQSRDSGTGRDTFGTGPDTDSS